MRRLPYTQEQRDWIAENAPWHCHEDTVDMFNETFSDRVMTTCALRSYMGRNGLAVLRSRKHDRFSGEELEFLKSVKGLDNGSSELIAEFRDRFPGSGKSDGQIRAYLKNHKVPTGIDGRFKKGDKPHTWKPVGTRKKWADGVWRVKVREKMPGDRNKHANWRPLGYVLWEEANGRPFPEGCMLRYADGDQDNLDADNLVPVPMEVNGIINSARIPYHDKASLERAIEIARLTREAKAKCEDAGVSWDRVKKEAANG